MDSSSRLEAVLGRFRIEAEQLSAEEWMQVIASVLEQYKPLLKYMPGFNAIGSEFNKATSNSGYDFRKTERDLVQFPTGIDPTAKCMRVAEITSELQTENPDVKSDHIVRKKDLYLWIGGEFLLSDCTYERVRRHGLGFRQHRAGTDDVTLKWKFTRVAEGDLMALLSPAVGCSILDAFIKYGRESIEKGRRNLADRERVAMYVWAIRRNIIHPHFG